VKLSRIEFLRNEEGSWLLWMVLCSGLLLLSLLPCGMWFGFGWIFKALFLAHLGLLVVSNLGAVRCILTAFNHPRWLRGSVALLLFGVVALETLLATLPLAATDALIHHLAVPRWWLESGAISQIPWHEWSFYPMLLNLGYSGLCLFRCSDLASLYHAMFALQLVGLTVWCGRHLKFQREQLLLVYVLTVIMPLWLRLSSVPLVDLGVAVFSLLAVAFVILGADLNGEGSETSGGVLAASGCGMALGLAAGCKLNGTLYAVVLIGTMIFGGAWSRLPRRTLIVVLLASLVTYLPWLLKNYLWTGNPIYPQFKSLLGGPVPSYSYLSPWVPPLQHRRLIYGESWLDIATLPIRMLLFGQDGDPRYYDGQLNPLLVMGFVACFMGGNRLQRVLFGWTPLVFTALALAFSSARVRYLAPIVPGLTLGASVVISSSLKAVPQNARTALWATLVIGSLGLSAQYVRRNLLDPVAQGYLLGTVSEDGYLATRIPEYPLIKYVNTTLPASSTVYLVGTLNAFYLYDRQVRSAGYYSTIEVIDWVKRSDTPRMIFDALVARSITHLLVNDARFAESMYERLTLGERQRWNAFGDEYLKGVASVRGYSLWEVIRP
jgi:hypothetical protein